MKKNCEKCRKEMIYGGPMVFASSTEMAKKLISQDPGPCPECADGTSHGKKLNADGTVRTNWFCENCKSMIHVNVPFDEWWAFSQEPETSGDVELKPKDDLLQEVFAYVRKEGWIPWVNEEDSDDDAVTVDQICVHGKSWESQYLVKDEASGLWGWDGGGEGDGFCMACEPDCDCGKPHEQSCPICHEPWPKFSEERLIEAWKSGEDLIHDTTCPKCGHAWTLSLEEVEKLHPEVLAQAEGRGGYREFPARGREAGPEPKPRPIRNGRPIGRNADCPCGSGKKYKRCCESK